MRSQWGVGLSIWRFIFLFALFLFRILVLLISIIIGFNGIHLFLTSCIVNNIFLSMLLSWIGWFIYIDCFFIFECLHWFTDFISDCMFFCSLCRFNADQFIQFFFVILSFKLFGKFYHAISRHGSICVKLSILNFINIFLIIALIFFNFHFSMWRL